MKTEHQNILIAVCVVAVIILLVICYNNNSYGEYLYGMWVADNDYCEESDLTGFMLMIGPSTGGILYDYRKMYVLMYNEEGMLCNRTVDVKLGASMYPGTYQNRSLTILEDDFEIMPQYMTLSTSIMNGHMVLYGTGEDSDTIYGSMYKDHDSTHKARAVEDSD